MSTDSLRQGGRRVATALALAVGGVFAIPDAAGAETLFDHTPSVIGFHPTIQDFESDFDEDDSFAADDFTVPAGQTWTPQRVLVDGRKPTDAGPGTTSTVNVALYATGGTLPTLPALYAAQSNADPGADYPDFDLALPGAPALGPGTYWFEAQPVMDFAPPANNYWFWGTVPNQLGNPAVYRNPGGGFNADCMSFGLMADCVADVTNPDLAFKLEGIRVVTPATGAPPPAPAATPTKKKCKKAKKRSARTAKKKCKKKK